MAPEEVASVTATPIGAFGRQFYGAETVSEAASPSRQQQLVEVAAENTDTQRLLYGKRCRDGSRRSFPTCAFHRCYRSRCQETASTQRIDTSSTSRPGRCLASLHQRPRNNEPRHTNREPAARPGCVGLRDRPSPSASQRRHERIRHVVHRNNPEMSSDERLAVLLCDEVVGSVERGRDRTAWFTYTPSYTTSDNQVPLETVRNFVYRA